MHLAQLNIAKAKSSLDSPVMKEFVDNLDPVNALAEASNGFVWRLKDESGDATSIDLFDNPLIITNMSVWESVDALKNFLFKTHHLNFLQRKSEWFDKLAESNHVMWWVPEGHIPGLDEGKERLETLIKKGDSPYAFTFRNIYSAE